MNSRNENGQTFLKDKSEIIETIKAWYDSGEIDNYTIYDDRVYYDDGGETYHEIYYPENDSAERIKSSLICDEEVESFVDTTALAELIFENVDMNALSIIDKIVLVYEKLDEEGNPLESEARNVLEKLFGDEYAQEVGEGLLGLTWIERSSIIINVSEIEKSAKDVLEDLYGENYTGNELHQEFSIAFLETVFHEFRHLVYECCEFIEVPSEMYPAFGGIEENVEEYGNKEAERLLSNDSSREKIFNVFSPLREKLLKENEFEL